MILVGVNPALGLVALAVVPVLAVFAVRQRRRSASAQQDARAESGRLAGASPPTWCATSAPCRLSGARRGPARCSAPESRPCATSNLRAVDDRGAWAPVADVVLAVGSGLVLVVGGRRGARRRMGTGDLLVVMSLPVSPVLAGARAEPAVRRAGEVGGAAQPASTRCWPTADERAGAERTRSAAPRSPGRRAVRARHFGYRDRPAGARPLSTSTMPAGDTVCLLGPSGAGKSTLLHLLLRLYDVDGGAGSDRRRRLRDCSRPSLRSTASPSFRRIPGCSTRRSPRTSPSALPGRARHRVLAGRPQQPGGRVRRTAALRLRHRRGRGRCPVVRRAAPPGRARPRRGVRRPDRPARRADRIARPRARPPR